MATGDLEQHEVLRAECLHQIGRFSTTVEHLVQEPLADLKSQMRRDWPKIFDSNLTARLIGTFGGKEGR